MDLRHFDCTKEMLKDGLVVKIPRVSERGAESLAEPLGSCGWTFYDIR